MRQTLKTTAALALSAVAAYALVSAFTKAYAEPLNGVVTQDLWVCGTPELYAESQKRQSSLGCGFLREGTPVVVLGAEGEYVVMELVEEPEGEAPPQFVAPFVFGMLAHR